MKKNRSLGIVFAISGLIVLFVIISSFSKSVIEVKLTREISVNSATTFEVISTSKNWKKWIWMEIEPSMEFDDFDKLSGQGAGMVWKSDYSGKGGLKITKAKSDSLIQYELVTDNSQFIEHGVFRIGTSPSGLTKIEWTAKIDFSRNVKAKYSSFFSDYQSMFENYNTQTFDQLIEIIKDEENNK